MELVIEGKLVAFRTTSKTGLLVEWLTRLTYNLKRVGERVRSRPGHIQKLVNKLLIQRGSVV
jgi:hypothetical protein